MLSKLFTQKDWQAAVLLSICGLANPEFMS